MLRILFGPRKDQDGHFISVRLSYADIVMKGAFVVRLGLETTPQEGRFEGWIEEVDSGIELRFHFAEDLLRFLGERFLAVLGPQPEVRSPEAPVREQGEP